MWLPRSAAASHRRCHIDSRYRIENIARIRGFGVILTVLLTEGKIEGERGKERGGVLRPSVSEKHASKEFVFDASEKVPRFVYRRNEFVNEAGHSGASVLDERHTRTLKLQ